MAASEPPAVGTLAKPEDRPPRKRVKSAAVVRLLHLSVSLGVARLTETR